MTSRPYYITFRADKNGKRFATYFYRGRNFRIALDRAELLIASGEGIEENA